MTREEAIEVIKAKADYLESDKRFRAAVETIIPELAESEDERIRKALIETVKCIYDGDTMFLSEQQRDRYLAYLEKQKEQRTAESISQLTVQGKGVYKICPRCKERMVRDDSMVYTSMPPQYRYECPKCGESEYDTVMYDNPEMEEQKPVDLSEMMVHKEPYIAPVPTPMVADEQKPAEWSEEDEKILDSLIRLYSKEYSAYAWPWANGAFTYGDVVKFLKSLKPSWKPSEGQMEAAEKRKMGITPIGIIRMKVQELKLADVDKAGDLDIHPLEKEKYNYAIKQCDKIIAFIDNLPLTITKESPELNEAANDYQTTFNKTIGPFFHDDQKRAFIDGALWQARQFIKGTPNRKP